MLAGWQCNFLNVLIYLKYECVVVELISYGRIEKGELGYKWWQGLCKYNLVGSEKSVLSNFMLIISLL